MPVAVACFKGSVMTAASPGSARFSVPRGAAVLGLLLAFQKLHRERHTHHSAFLAVRLRQQFVDVQRVDTARHESPWSFLDNKKKGFKLLMVLKNINNVHIHA